MGKPHLTAPYAEQSKELKTFFKELGVLDRAEFVPLDDPFGTTLSGSYIEALVVSEETKPVAFKINEKPHLAGLPQLKVGTVVMVPSDNFAPISTTRIRRGEMDHEVTCRSKLAPHKNCVFAQFRAQG